MQGGARHTACDRGATDSANERHRKLWPGKNKPDQSTAGPWPVPLMISGARYSSVPTKELARPSGSAISVNCSDSAAVLFSALLPCCLCKHDSCQAPDRRFHNLIVKRFGGSCRAATGSAHGSEWACATGHGIRGKGAYEAAHPAAAGLPRAARGGTLVQLGRGAVGAEGQVEVCQQRMAVAAEQDVLRLQVPANQSVRLL